MAIHIPVFVGATFAVGSIKLNPIGPATYVDVMIHSDHSGVLGTIINT